MQIPIKAAIIGLRVLADIFGADKPPAITEKPAGLPARATRPDSVATAFQDAMKVANKMQQLGDKIDGIKRQKVETLMASGDIPQALQMLEQLTSN